MNKSNLIVGSIIILLLPVLLNFLLPICTGLNVIGGGNSVLVWLQFWGTYLGAIGAATAAIAAVVNAIKNRKRDNLKYELDSLTNQYTTIEQEVLKAEKVHSLSNATSIAHTMNEDIVKARELQQQWFSQLTESSLLSIKYCEKGQSHDHYYDYLCKINKDMIDLCIKIGQTINEGSSEELNKVVQEASRTHSDDYLDLFRQGFDYLMRRKEDIRLKQEAFYKGKY